MVKIKAENRTSAYIVKVVVILLVIFGIFVAYQLIRLIFGGSWSVENIIVSLLVFNIGAVFTIGLMLATLVSDLKHLISDHKYLTSDHKHLADSFNRLARDFKEHIKHK